ncbi:hypothetical protein ACFL6B_01970 [Thermodesulfobacteriota bacterium]
MSHLPESEPIHITYFVSPHGFGHAARASAVMEALHRINPAICFDIYTTVPLWFFQESLSGPHTYTSMMTDVGLVQQTPFQEDLPATLERLDSFLPFDAALIADLAVRIRQTGCKAVLCDIAPLGISVARAAGVTSVLIENFTWDWVYQGYVQQMGRIVPHIQYLKAIFNGADIHIQAQPLCSPTPANLTTLPVSRMPRTNRDLIRRQLAVPDHAKLIVLALGGAADKNVQLERLPILDNVYFIIPGAAETLPLSENIIALPNHSPFFHPDLIQASDAVIGKVGYSTLAEVYHAGLPYGYIPHAGFRESALLEAFISDHMQGFPITEVELQNGIGEHRLQKLTALPHTKRTGLNGADQIAEYVYSKLEP